MIDGIDHGWEVVETANVEVELAEIEIFIVFRKRHIC